MWPTFDLRASQLCPFASISHLHQASLWDSGAPASACSNSPSHVLENGPASDSIHPRRRLVRHAGESRGAVETGGTRHPITSTLVPLRASPDAASASPPTRSAAPQGRALIAGRRARPNTAPSAMATPRVWRTPRAQAPSLGSRPAMRADAATAPRNARSAVVSRSLPSRVRPWRRASTPSSQSVSPPATITVGSPRGDRRTAGASGTSQKRPSVSASAGDRRSRGLPSPPSAMPRCQSSICHTASHQSNPGGLRSETLGCRFATSQAASHPMAPITPHRRACRARQGWAPRASADRSSDLRMKRSHAVGR